MLSNIIDSFPCQLGILIIVILLSYLGMYRLISMWNYSDQFKSLNEE